MLRNYRRRFSVFMKKFYKNKWRQQKQTVGTAKRDYSRQIAFLNRYSILFHALLSCMLVFIIEICSRRSLVDACAFLGSHAFAFLFNALIIFFTLSVVYLFRRRMLMRIIISCVWLLLGIINGCVLSQRVTPFGYTDLKCISDLLTMTNTQYFTKTQEICVVILLSILVIFLVVLALKGPKFQGHPHKPRFFDKIIVDPGHKTPLLGNNLHHADTPHLDQRLAHRRPRQL